MIRSHKLTPAAQLFGLRSRYPDGEGELQCHGRRMRWRQRVKPHVLCGTYLIEVRLEQDSLPETLVLFPDIQEQAGARKLPHTYSPVDGKPSLCLWWKNDWNRGLAISDTIIPWAAEWFWFYEHWLVTGEWLGGGSHPTEINPPSTAPEATQRCA